MSELKVVVPLDGSKLAESALGYLPILRKLGDPRVRLVSVVDETALLALPDAVAWQEREGRLLRDYMDAQKARLEGEGFAVEAEVKEGQPAALVAEEAEHFGADLLILSSHGRSGPERWRIGSVADKLIRIARCNTLVIGPAATKRPPAITSILLPLDGSERAERAMPVARDLATRFNASLHVVRIANYPVFADETSGYAWQAIREACQAYVQEKASELGAKGALFVGDAATELLKYAEAEHIDLIVLTSHGRSGLLRVALGSVADRLIGGPAAVLICRDPRAKAAAESA